MPRPPASPPSPAPAPGKPWYESKAVIGGILAIVLPLISAAFPAFKLVDPNTAADTLIKVIQVLGPVAGGILAIFGRIKAVDPIAGTQAAQIVANRMQQAETPIEDTINQSSMMTLPLGVILSELPSVIEAIGQLAAIPKLPANQNVNFAVIPASPPNGAANALAAGNAPN